MTNNKWCAIIKYIEKLFSLLVKVTYDKRGGNKINSTEDKMKNKLAKFVILFSSTVVVGQSLLHLQESLNVSEDKLERVSEEKEILSQSLHTLEKKYQESNFEIDELVIKSGELAQKLTDAEDKNKSLSNEISSLKVELKSEKEANEQWAFEETMTPQQNEFEENVVSEPIQEGLAYIAEESSDGWVTMNAEATAYTMVANGDTMGGTGLTSTGTVPTANRTIAVDPNVIPYGSLVRYNGVTYTAEDTGGVINGNKVDFYFDTLEECISFGIQNITIEVKV